MAIHDRLRQVRMGLDTSGKGIAIQNESRRVVASNNGQVIIL